MAAPGPRTTFAERALAAVCILFSLFLLGHLIAFQYGRDQAIYAHVAEQMLKGRALYLEAWDMKWPGLYFVYAAVHLATGGGMWGIRVLEAVLLVSMAWPCVMLSRRYVDSGTAGVLGWTIAVYAHVRLEFWNTAQAESFAAAAILWALWLASPGHRRAALLAAGALYGFAALLKPLLGIVIVASWLFLALDRRRDGVPLRDALSTSGVALAIGAAVPILLTLIYLALTGAIAAAYDALLVFGPLYAATTLRPEFVVGVVFTSVSQWTYKFSAYFLLGLPLLLALPPLRGSERRGSLLLGAAAGLLLLGVAVQAKFFGYHYGAALPLGALLTAWGLWKIWVRWRARTIGILAFFALLFALHETELPQSDGNVRFWHRCAIRLEALRDPELRERAADHLYTTGDMDRRSIRDVALGIARNSPEDAVLFVWGYEPLIYHFAERAPASRYAFNLAQRVPGYRQAARAKLMSDLRATPPDIVVVEHGDAMRLVTGSGDDSYAELSGFRELAAMLTERYEVVDQVADFEVLRRKAQP